MCKIKIYLPRESAPVVHSKQYTLDT